MWKRKSRKLEYFDGMCVFLFLLKTTELQTFANPYRIDRNIFNPAT